MTLIKSILLGLATVPFAYAILMGFLYAVQIVGKWMERMPL